MAPKRHDAEAETWSDLLPRGVVDEMQAARTRAAQRSAVREELMRRSYSRERRLSTGMRWLTKVAPDPARA